MPELPEVETVVQGLLRANLIGLQVSCVEISWPKLVEEGDAALLLGTTLERIYRRGKYIILEFSKKCFLLIHLRMTGKIHLVKPSDPLQAHEKGRIHFADLVLCYTDVRTFGRWYQMHDVQAFLAHLGPDPFDETFNGQLFVKALLASNRGLKALLLDQSFIAGVGNIYADEALFLARLHPLRKANSLTKKEASALFQAIRHVLEQGIVHGGSSLGQGKGNFKGLYGSFGKNQERFKVYQRQGLPCPNCANPIEKITVNQRSTHFCPSCQKL